MNNLDSVVYPDFECHEPNCHFCNSTAKDLRKEGHLVFIVQHDGYTVNQMKQMKLKIEDAIDEILCSDEFSSCSIS
jgi:hypothetical protein